MQNRFSLLDTHVMPMFMIIALDIVITMRFSINCPIVTYSPTACFLSEREASSENYGPQVYLYHILKSKNTLLQFIYHYFIFWFCLSIYHYAI